MLSKSWKEGITETLEILKFSTEEELEKIPKKFMKFLNDNKSENYYFKIYEKEEITKLKLKNETKNLFAFIAYTYWSDTEEKKEKFQVVLKNNQQLVEDKKREKFKGESIFSQINTVPKEIRENAVIVHKESVFEKIKRFCFNLFKNKR